MWAPLGRMLRTSSGNRCLSAPDVASTCPGPSRCTRPEGAAAAPLPRGEVSPHDPARRTKLTAVWPWGSTLRVTRKAAIIVVGPHLPPACGGALSLPRLCLALAAGALRTPGDRPSAVHLMRSVCSPAVQISAFPHAFIF